ncbi:Protein SanA [Flavobacterium sp. 9AF]|uniref:SanA/YdcF family protein n=1 Tax=Flavobacterium sp. 9AF TaxID=2653142 RepID=UPI0012EF32BA|nr:ElyC/SanA/YdcF family protein [Flavobacterium sp. 9AF]VXB69513.1 Protein SanA [Flavobacterium sp. 9AF]
MIIKIGNLLFKIKKYIFPICVFLLFFICAANTTIKTATKNKIFSEVTMLPKNKVGVVLGTGKYLKNGTLNLYFSYRIAATVDLFKQGKIEYILVSGDNSTEEYDEPNDFKKELIEQGVPEDKIVLDYAGFRTLDSVIRAKEVFGLTNFTLISQQFHNERALYIATRNNINAVAFNAKDVSKYYGIKVQIREYLARTKVFIDLFFKVKPKFLGPRITIG